jgi:hypothetical protein
MDSQVSRETLHQGMRQFGRDARAARQLAAVEPAWVRKTPTGGNRRARSPLARTIVGCHSAEIRRPIPRLPDRPRNLPTVLRPDTRRYHRSKYIVHQHITRYLT